MVRFPQSRWISSWNHKMFPLCFHKKHGRKKEIETRNSRNLLICKFVLLQLLLFRFFLFVFATGKIGKLDLNNGQNLVKPTPSVWMILCILNKSIDYCTLVQYEDERLYRLSLPLHVSTSSILWYTMFWNPSIRYRVKGIWWRIAFWLATTRPLLYQLTTGLLHHQHWILPICISW